MKAKILFQGRFSKSDVVCKYSSISPRKINTEIENKAKQIWEEKSEEAKGQGKKMWDQPVYRLDDFTLNKGRCFLTFSTIPFSIRTSVKDFTEQLIEMGKEYLPMATYSSFFIETEEGNFVFGVKSNIYVTNRSFSYIGGVFNQEKGDCSHPPLFDDSLKEVKEELGIVDSVINDFRLLGAFQSETCNVGFIFYCKVKLSADEVKGCFEEHNDLELKELTIVELRDLRDFCIKKIGKEAEIVDIFEQTMNG